MSNVVKIRCTICETVKDESAFHIKSSSHLGKDRRCKPCKAIIRHEYHLKSEYNLTVEEYDNMLKQQGGTCANEFCDYGKDDDHKLFVDHCHATGTVRGLLCHWCNSAEGYLKGSPEVAQGLTNYMKKHNNERS
jgi:hypothetical protein